MGCGGVGVGSAGGASDLEASHVPHGGSCQQGRTAVGSGAASAAAPCFGRMPSWRVRSLVVLAV